MSKSESESREIQLLKSQIAALEQLLDVYEKSVVENTDKLYTEITEHKKAEESLRESEEKLRVIFESLSEGFTMSDLNGVILEVNAASLRLHGFDKKEELIGQNAFKLIAQKEQRRAVQDMERLLREGSFKAEEYTLLRKDGSEFTAEMSASTIKDVTGKPVAMIVTFSDVTERKNMELEREKNRNFLQVLLDSIPVPVYYKDIDGIFQGCNEYFEKYMHLKKSEIIGKSVYDIAPKALADIYKQKDIELFNNPGIQVYESLVKDLAGNQHNVIFHKATYLADDGSVGGLIGAIMDTTEIKQAEIKIKQAYDTLTEVNKKIEYHDKQVSILGEMTEMLQLCSNLKETGPVVASHFTRLFAKLEGSLFIYNNSRTELQLLVRWGESPEDSDESIFTPDSCWGLRRGNVYVVNNPEIEPICPHIKGSPITAYACLPLIARGEILGLLYLKTKQSIPDKQKVIAGLNEIAYMLVEYLSLSIANIKLRESLINQSIKDPLTGLFNRRYMEEALQRELARAERKSAKLSVVMMDIDHFKQFNDIYGHEAGDELLVRLAEFFRLKIRQSDVFCRFGGEEFVMIMPESTSDDTFKRVDMFRDEVKSMYVHFRNQRLPAIAISMGIATYPEHGTSSSDLIQVADKALYRAKQQGRDRVIIGSI